MSYPVVLDKWSYFTFTWSETEGLSLYEDGIQKASDTLGKTVAHRVVNSAQTNLCIGGRVPNMFGSDFARFSIKSLAVFGESISDKQMSNLASYYNDYDGSSKQNFGCLLKLFCAFIH